MILKNIELEELESLGTIEELKQSIELWESIRDTKEEPEPEHIEKDCDNDWWVCANCGKCFKCNSELGYIHTPDSQFRLCEHCWGVKEYVWLEYEHTFEEYYQDIVETWEHLIKDNQ